MSESFPYRRGTTGDALQRLRCLCADGQDLDPYVCDDLKRLLSEFTIMADQIRQYQEAHSHS